MLELKVIGAKLTARHFLERSARAKKPRQIMNVIGAKAFKDVLNSFDKEENENGKKWAKWKDPKTGQRVTPRPYGRGGNKLLQDTGLLRESIRWKTSKKWAKVFTNRKYAKYHDKGKGTMKRQFMWVNTKLRLSFVKMLAGYIKDGR